MMGGWGVGVETGGGGGVAGTFQSRPLPGPRPINTTFLF